MVELPNVRFLMARPALMDSVSVSRTTNRAISFVETADPFWQITMPTAPLSAREVALLEAFREEVRTGRKTVRYTPRHVCLPQAYWGNPASPVLANEGNLVSVVNGFTVNLNSVTNGLTLTRGDLFSLTYDGYRSMHRVQATAVAAASAISLSVEPFVPPYIRAGAVAKFKDPELNMRVLPGSFTLPDEFFPSASFTLVEVPK